MLHLIRNFSNQEVSCGGKTHSVENTWGEERLASKAMINDDLGHFSKVV